MSSSVRTVRRVAWTSYAEPAGVELQEWLDAKEVGRHQISTDLTAHFGVGTMFAPTCFLQASLEGHSN